MPLTQAQKNKMKKMKITGSGALEGLTSSLNKFGIGGRQSMKK